MARNITTTLPHTGVSIQNQLPASNVIEEVSPQIAAITICETVRDEHGRKGVGAFLAAAAPFLPQELLAETARHFRLEPPPGTQPVPEKPPQKEAPPIPPELLMQLLQSSGGGGLDPMTLLKLMQK